MISKNDRERMRFEAALACLSRMAVDPDRDGEFCEYASDAVEFADALLDELYPEVRE